MTSIRRPIPVALSLLFLFGCVLQDFQAQGFVEGSFQRSLAVSGPTDLEATTGAGAITVRTGPAGRVDVQAQVRVGDRDRGRQRAEELLAELQMNPPIEQNGNVIRIGTMTISEARENVSISYVITVPSDTTLRTRTGSGEQIVEGISGRVDAVSGSGGITISNVASHVSANTGSGGIVAERIAGGFSGRTGSGSIRMNQTAAGDVEAFTGSGGVALSGVRGAVRVRTGSGSIAVDGEPTGRWELNAGSGSVVVKVPPEAALSLNLRTGSGGIDVNHPVTVQGAVRRNNLVGTVRGGGTELGVRTGSGSIRID